VLDELSYAEACELAYFGAKVLHPQTMAPAVARDIPLIIRNTFKSEHPGTRISAARTMQPPVKGLTTASDLALVNIEGTGMIGVPGTAERLFAALKAERISVAMISQGSSEHSICCVVDNARADAAVAAIRTAFAPELASGQVQDVNAERDIAVLAAVGEGMAGTPGIAARFFGALARANINVRAIAQGASERNISAAIDARDATRALRAVHAGFYLSPQTLSVGVIGPGQVGRALLHQLAESAPRLRERTRLDLRLRAVSDSKRMRLSETGFDPADWSQALNDSAVPVELGTLAAHVRAEHLPHAVIVDCSASDAVAQHYADWLARGIHVITPNKRAGSGPAERYAAIRAAEATGGTRFRYEATVGAGLPVIQTLRDLLDTGDELISIEGMLSGTLAYLFNRYDGSQPFSALVVEARALGYTEPDPRDDLGGLDVARKLVILAREWGMSLDLDSVAVESLVPPALAAVGVDEFMVRAVELDLPLAARLEHARSNGKVLRHVARVDASGAARVEVMELPLTHPFAVARATDNVVQFVTRRYHDNPLVVQGPGAGPEVTAAGVFADLLRLAASVGARL
jgi:aspartokinase/homoserine dehydrogenase 1